MPLFEPTYFSTHIKQNLYRLCSKPTGYIWHLGSISHLGTMYIDDVLSIYNPAFEKYLDQISR